MRLRKRECSEPAFFDEVCTKAEELFLAMHDTEFPYLIPVNFVRQGEHIYIHCALEGHKLDLLTRDNRVAFSMAADVKIDRAKASTYYKSVCGTGRAVIVDDPAEKSRALACIGTRYNAPCGKPAHGSEPLPGADAARVQIIRIDILSMTGKRNLP